MPAFRLHSADFLGSPLRQTFLAFALILASLSPRQASAALVVSNLGNSQDIADLALYNSWDNYRALSTAGSFTTGTSSLNLDSFILSLQGMFDPSFNNGGFTVSLYSDNVGLPGSDLGVVFMGSSSPDVAGQYAYAASNPYTLTASTNYWVVASINPLAFSAAASGYHVLYTFDASETGSGTTSGWSINNGDAEIDSNSDTGDWKKITTISMMFAVDASPVPVPEPGSALLLLCASGLLLRRRRK